MPRRAPNAQMTTNTQRVGCTLLGDPLKYIGHKANLIAQEIVPIFEIGQLEGMPHLLFAMNILFIKMNVF